MQNFGDGVESTPKNCKLQTRGNYNIKKKVDGYD